MSVILELLIHIPKAKLGNAKTRNGSLDCVVVSMQAEDGDAGMRSASLLL